MVTIVPPSRISGSARRARSRKDQQETSIAVRKPSRGQSVTRPCSASFGAKAMEWTRTSSRPHCLPIASKTWSASAGWRTSSGRKIGASSARASGSTWGRAFSFR